MAESEKKKYQKMCEEDPTDDQRKEECVKFLEGYIVKKPDETCKGLITTLNVQEQIAQTVSMQE